MTTEGLKWRCRATVWW